MLFVYCHGFDLIISSSAAACKSSESGVDINNEVPTLEPTMLTPTVTTTTKPSAQETSAA